MTTPQSPRLEVRLAVPRGSEIDSAELPALAAQLQAELRGIGVTDVAIVSAAPPPGARFVGLEVAIGLIVSLTSAAASAVTVAEYISRWRSRDQQRSQLVVTVEEPAPPPRGEPTTRSALIIANAAYTDPALSRLRSPGEDAEALATVLADPHIGGFDVQVAMDATEGVVRRRLAAFFADRDRDDLLFVHFSCHGLKDSRGRLYLAAQDTELRSFSATAVPASFVADQMSETGSRRVVLVLDCCYSGAFARGAVVRGDRRVHLNDEFGAVASGRIVLTASTATEYAFEGDQVADEAVRPSVFTSAFVEGLRTGAADLDGDGVITVDELYSYTLRRVREARSDQEPMKWVYGLSDALVIARSPRIGSLPPHVLADLASDRVQLRLQAIATMRQLMTAGHQGSRHAISQRLRELAAGDDSFTVRQAAEAALSDVEHQVPAPTPAFAPHPAPVSPAPPVAPASPAPAFAPSAAPAPAVFAAPPGTPASPAPAQRPAPSLTSPSPAGRVYGTAPVAPRPRSVRGWRTAALFAAAIWVVLTVGVGYLAMADDDWGDDETVAAIAGMLGAGLISLWCSYLAAPALARVSAGRAAVVAIAGTVATVVTFYTLGLALVLAALVLSVVPPLRQRLARGLPGIGGWRAFLSGPPVFVLTILTILLAPMSDGGGLIITFALLVAVVLMAAWGNAVRRGPVRPH